MTISEDRLVKRFSSNKGELTVETNIGLPKNLQSIVENAPKDDADLGQYLKDLVADGTITIDEVNFLLESEAFA